MPPGRPWPVLLTLMSTWDKHEDLFPEECLKCCEHSGSHRVTGSEAAESHTAFNSQPLPALPHFLSPCHFSASVNDSGSSGSPIATQCP